ncbi:unnamed protein product [Rhodiola kirilowii]
MAAVLARFSPSRIRLLSSFTVSFSSHITYAFPSLSRPLPRRRFSISSCGHPAADTSLPVSSLSPAKWKPICLYYTQGRCTMMDDPLHLEKFNHSCSLERGTDYVKVDHLPSQDFDHFLVLDLEGKVEILEFPVLMISATSLEVVDFFHRFVRPTEMSEQRIAEYIDGKYGKFGVDRVWHDTAIPFKEVIEQFEGWLAHHQLWSKESGVGLNQAAFVTCGNWDLKTKVPQQCKVANMELPKYFMEWINLKDVFLNFYKRTATGMMPMLRQLQIPQLGSHHLGIDDTKNIARVLQRMIVDGAIVKVSARRNPKSPESVEFLFKNRISRNGRWPSLPALDVDNVVH